MGEPGYRPMRGGLLGCAGLACFPAACLMFSLMDPPTAVISPNYVLPSTGEKATYLLTALILLGGGYVALRISSAWSRKPKSAQPAPAPAPALNDLDEEVRATVLRRTYAVAGVVGLVGTAVWVTGFLLGRDAPHDIRVRDGGELAIALLQHVMLTGSGDLGVLCEASPPSPALRASSAYHGGSGLLST